MGKREENRKRKQEAILSAAMRTFAQKGFAAASMAEIARTAGVGKGTIYEYHRSKDDLFFAVFRWYIDELISNSLIDVTSLGGDDVQRLRTLLNSIITASHDQIEFFSIFFEFWAAVGGPSTQKPFRDSMLSAYNSFRSILIVLITDGKKSGVFRQDIDEVSVSAGLVGAMDGLMLQAWMDRKFNVFEASKIFFETIIKGMITPEKEPP